MQNNTKASAASGFFRRLRAMTHKEFLQLYRDSSSLLMGVILPMVLILLVGYGMSLDVKHIPLAVVLEDHSSVARDAVGFVNDSEYFDPQYVNSRLEAESMMREHQVTAVMIIPNDFSSKLAIGSGKVQLLLNGVESTAATSAQSYLQAGIASWAASRGIMSSAKGQAVIYSRVWFNDANTSTWFFVPGILMLVLTISGVFLTAVVMAREWERGTLEALFVTPMRIVELVLSKMIPYFVVAIMGMMLCLWIGYYFYDLPLRGGLPILLAVSMLYLVVALGIGLVISALTKNQFLACQVALLVNFLPSIMLSGFMFDMHSEPMIIKVVSHVFPMTYYLQLMRSLCLSGVYWPLVWQNIAILCTFAVGLICLAMKLTRKRVA